jgi:hypothetical protein
MFLITMHIIINIIITDSWVGFRLGPIYQLDYPLAPRLHHILLFLLSNLLAHLLDSLFGSETMFQLQTFLVQFAAHYLFMHQVY